MHVHDEMSDTEVLRAASAKLSAIPMGSPPDVAAIMARGSARRRHRLAVTGVVILLAACGGTAAGVATFRGGTYAQSLAYAKCMRSHGVPQFPAPDAQGNFNNAQIENIDQNDQPTARNANAACSSLLPNAGTGLTVTQLQTMLQQNLRNAVKSAHCMRAHGIENFADPAGSTQGSGIDWGPVLQAGLNLNTPSYKAAYDACQTRGDHIIPPFLAPGFVPTSTIGSGRG
jgi:hypothetical protein